MAIEHFVESAFSHRGLALGRVMYSDVVDLGICWVFVSRTSCATGACVGCAATLGPCQLQGASYSNSSRQNVVSTCLLPKEL